MAKPTTRTTGKTTKTMKTTKTGLAQATGRPTAPTKAKPRTNPLREDTWEPMEEPIYDHVFEELYESAYDNEVRNLDALQVPMEQVARHLMRRFLAEAQKLLKALLIEAATLAQTEASLRVAAKAAKKANAKRKS